MLKLWGRNNSVNVPKAIWCLEELKLPYERIDAALAEGDYIAGSALTIGDIPLGNISWRWFGIDVERPSLPNVEAWFKRLSRREAFKRSMMLPLT